jgi:hypothetical protein
VILSSIYLCFNVLGQPWHAACGLRGIRTVGVIPFHSLLCGFRDFTQIYRFRDFSG